MADYKWPDAEKRTLIGKRISRLDGPAKVSGKAKYCYDYNRPGPDGKPRELHIDQALDPVATGVNDRSRT